MDPAVIKVEVERRWFAIAEGERGCCFSRVGEAVQLGEMQSAVPMCLMSRRTPPAPIAASC